MTYNPETLQALGKFWVAQGGVNLGVVGDQAHAAKGYSYHLGKDQLATTAYSIQTTRDQNGLTNAASAIDLGRLDGNFTNLREFSKWLVAQAQANKPGTSDIREIIYSPDGKIVLRWDRQRGFDSTPRQGEADDSHLTHTHISWYRDSEKRDKVAVFQPYFEENELIDFTLASDEKSGWIKVKEAGASVVTIDGGDRPNLPAGLVRPSMGPAFLKIRGELKHYIVFIGTTEIGFVNENQVDFTPCGTGDDGITQAQVDAARAEGVISGQQEGLTQGVTQEKSRLRKLLGL